MSTLNWLRISGSYSKMAIGKKLIAQISFRFANNLQRLHIPFTQKQVKQMMITAEFADRDCLLDTCVNKTLMKKQDSSWIEKKVDVPNILAEFEEMLERNVDAKCFIGQGFYPTHVPSIIKRCVLENPRWYTAYTPYQAEISQGRLEALFNYQILIKRITRMEIANACLLDEATAGAEAVLMAYHIHNNLRNVVFIQKNLFKSTKAVIRDTVGELGIECIEIDRVTDELIKCYEKRLIGFVGQSPDMYGYLADFSADIEKVKSVGGLSIIGTDLLSCIMAKTPGDMGADIAYGNGQRFGTPMGFGGPHAAFFATKKDYVRKIPGRIVSICKDSLGKTAFRMAMQTREQHIRREKATSNICTSQVLLANMNFFYALYHGEDGLRRIAKNVHSLAIVASQTLKKSGVQVLSLEDPNEITFFDTFVIEVPNAEVFLVEANKKGFAFYKTDDQHISISLDETCTKASVQKMTRCVQKILGKKTTSLIGRIDQGLKLAKVRGNEEIFKSEDIFGNIIGEHELLRYITRLENKDITLCNSMIPLGSCTMKLNSAFELENLTHRKANLHPYLPKGFFHGYQEIISRLSVYLCVLTGMDGVTYQANSGATGEYVGLKIIKRYFKNRGQEHRNIVLIPSSAHGTNPASAAKMGLTIVALKILDNGYIDLQDLESKVHQNKDNLFGMMLTFPSTHGVFEEQTKVMMDIVHNAGGLVYIDGANMNAQLMLTSPGFIGGDVCHLNLHKTFAIPHGGGGPGMGPVLVKQPLIEFLPTHVENEFCAFDSLGNVLRTTYPQTLSSPFGSASILSISFLYCEALGLTGLRNCSIQAILSANYLAKRLKSHYPILFKNSQERVAHEFIIDIRPIKAESGISEEDIAKRLMDYNYHAPTMSFPVPGTLMIEPTESESLAELDRFVDAMIQIKMEIKKVNSGIYDKLDNPLKQAPHTLEEIIKQDWNHKYTREEAAFPLPYLRTIGKVWPSVNRINNVEAEKSLCFEY